MSKSILDMADELADAADTQLASAPAALPAGPVNPVHSELAGVLVDFMKLGRELASAGKETPFAIRAMLSTIQSFEPFMLENISKMEPARVVEFATEVRGRIDRIIAAGQVNDVNGGPGQSG